MSSFPGADGLLQSRTSVMRLPKQPDMQPTRFSFAALACFASCPKRNGDDAVAAAVVEIKSRRLIIGTQQHISVWLVAKAQPDDGSKQEIEVESVAAMVIPEKDSEPRVRGIVVDCERVEVVGEVVASA